MTRCDDAHDDADDGVADDAHDDTEDGEDDVATALLVLRTGDAGAAELDRLYDVLARHEVQRGHLVGPVLPITGRRSTLDRIATTVHDPQWDDGRDEELVAALDPVDQFAWDEGAETF